MSAKPLLAVLIEVPLRAVNRWRFARANRNRRDPVIALPLGFRPAAQKPPGRIAVVLHAHYTDFLGEFRDAFNCIPFPFALFISTDTGDKKALIEQVFAEWKPEIRIFPNRGRDIAPKFVGFRDIYDRYDFVLFVHTKKSVHTSGLDAWRRFLLGCLLGSAEIVAGIFEIFKDVPEIGVIAPRNYAPIRRYMVWGDNFENCKKLAARMSVKLKPSSPLDFAAGSMFWGRPAALQPLLKLGLSFDDFDEEQGQIDGTLAHAIERLSFYACEKAGFRWVHAGPCAAPSPFETLLDVASRDDLGKAVASGAFDLLPNILKAGGVHSGAPPARKSFQ